MSFIIETLRNILIMYSGYLFSFMTTKPNTTYKSIEKTNFICDKTSSHNSQLIIKFFTNYLLQVVYEMNNSCYTVNMLLYRDYKKDDKEEGDDLKILTHQPIQHLTFYLKKDVLFIKTDIDNMMIGTLTLTEL